MTLDTAVPCAMLYGGTGSGQFSFHGRNTVICSNSDMLVFMSTCEIVISNKKANISSFKKALHFESRTIETFVNYLYHR